MTHSGKIDKGYSYKDRLMKLAYHKMVKGNA